jgi:predicted phosphodiesterase
MRVAIITDTHGNLPALQAALCAIDRFGVDLLIHTGDAIGIGPYPRECLEILTTWPATRCLMGNHDAWYAFGLPQPRPEWMGLGEWAHQEWTHAAIGSDLRATVAAWPYTTCIDSPAGAVEFLHFPRTPSGDFLMPNAAPKTGETADTLFQSDARLIFYGHHHEAADFMGAKGRYINPGSLGCAPQPVARIAFLVEQGRSLWQVTFSSIPYDPTDLLVEFDRREVPERVFIRRVFMPFGPNAPTT